MFYYWPWARDHHHKFSLISSELFFMLWVVDRLHSGPRFSTQTSIAMAAFVLIFWRNSGALHWLFRRWGGGSVTSACNWWCMLDFEVLVRCFLSFTLLLSLVILTTLISIYIYFNCLLKNTPVVYSSLSRPIFCFLDEKLNNSTVSNKNGWLTISSCFRCVIASYQMSSISVDFEDKQFLLKRGCCPLTCAQPSCTHSW